MRLNKIMALGLMSAMALVSCQQTVTPTGDSAVGFASAEFESGLGSEYIYVPIVTTGETTVYPIKVNIEVGEYTGDYAAKEDVDFMITSKEILVASAQSQPSVEIKIVNPSDADQLNFKLVISSQDNAQSISQGEVLVMCEKSFLDRICGKWNVTGTLEGSSYSEVWTFSNEGGQPAITGIHGETQGYILGTIDEAKREVSFTIGEGSGNMTGAYNFTGIGAAYVGPIFGRQSAEGVSLANGELVGVISDDFNSIEWQIPAGYGIANGVFSYDDAMELLGYFVAPLFIDGNTITKQPK